MGLSACHVPRKYELMTVHRIFFRWGCAEYSARSICKHHMVLEVQLPRMVSTTLVYNILSAPALAMNKITVGGPIHRKIRAFEQSK